MRAFISALAVPLIWLLVCLPFLTVLMLQCVRMIFLGRIYVRFKVLLGLRIIAIMSLSIELCYLISANMTKYSHLWFKNLI